MEFMKKVNEISKAVGKTASETYSTVADKSGKLVEEAKLKITKNYLRPISVSASLTTL